MSIYVGDVGTEITLDCGSDIGTATVRKIRVMKPDYSSVEWVAQDAGASSIKYVTVDGDLIVDGTYYLQAYLEMPGWKGCGDPVAMTVKRRLGA